LPAADGDHRVDGLDARLHRRVHRRAQHHARRDHLDRPCRHRAWQRTLAIQRCTERIDYATDQFRSHWYRGNATGSSYLVAFLDVGVWPNNHDADRFLFEVECDAHHVLLGELDRLQRADVAQAIHAGDTVADLHNRADLACLHGRREVLDLL